jgi:catechol 2,3-dioxygenase-like lactoylglutathione lyase family enzyme
VTIRAFHHVAYRCRDSEETRKFYENFLGLELAGALDIRATQTGRQTKVLHTFFRLGDGTFLAFFEAPDQAFDFKPQHDFDLHVAMEVESEAELQRMLERGKALGIETRGPSDHGLMRSIYFRDPNGYVAELTVRTEAHEAGMDPRRNGARATLDRWQAEKAGKAA